MPAPARLPSLAAALAALALTGPAGTTEHAHVGVGGDGITLHQYSDPSGSGAFLAFEGDGDSGSFDYVHFTEEAGRVPTDDASYLAGSGSNLEPLYQGLFPAPNGSPTNLWTTLRIAVAGGTVTYALDGTPIVSASTAATDGFVSLGYADVFSSLAEPAQSQFVLYDNLRVAVPEPATALLVAGASAPGSGAGPGPVGAGCLRASRIPRRGGTRRRSRQARATPPRGHRRRRTWSAPSSGAR